MTQASLAAVAGLLVIAGCASGNGATEVSAAGGPGMKTVSVQEIRHMQISAPIEQVADVVASAQADIVAKAAADIVEIVAERGATVNRGDVLIRLDNTDALLALDQARLSYENAKLALASGKREWQHQVAQLEQALTEATRHYNKTRNDYDLGLVDKRALDQAENAHANVQRELTLVKETSVSALELQVELAKLALEMAENALANHEIKAPIDGIITHLDAVVGTPVAPGVPLGIIQQLDPAEIKVHLTEEMAGLVRGKDRLAFRVAGDAVDMIGDVAYLSDVIDPYSNAYELSLSVSNPERVLKPGMKVQVRLTDEEQQQALAIPTLSIVREGADSYVFVYRNGTVERRMIELGRLNGLLQEVLSGVQEGELLVITGQHQLTDGEQVAIEEEVFDNGGA